MRRHQPVRRRESRDQRQAEAEQWRASLTLRGEQDRGQEHQAHLEEHRQADDESGQHQGPIETPFAKRVGQRSRHDHGAARLGEQLSDHRAEADHHGDGSERVAHAGLKRARNLGQRHPRRKSDKERGHGQRKKRRNARPGNEQHDERNA